MDRVREARLVSIGRHANMYSTTAIADYGVAFLKEQAKEHANDPFFLCLAPHSPHFPLQAPAEHIEKYEDRFVEAGTRLAHANGSACAA